MPRLIAFLQTGTSALVSLAEIAMASTFCAMRESMTAICSSAVAFVAGVEEAVAERLDDHGDAEIAGGKRRTDADASAGDDRNAAHELQNGPSIEHVFLLFSFFIPRMRHGLASGEAGRSGDFALSWRDRRFGVDQ
jgi:hypothetical protein